jgi:hypothetical protein
MEGREEIIRAEIENRKNISVGKSWFLEKFNKIDKPLVRMKREKNERNKIRNKRGLITDFIEINGNKRVL